MIQLKPGIKIDKLKPQMIFPLMAAQSIFDELSLNMVITSGNDGAHKYGSKHYTGEAIDIRTRDLTETQKRLLVARLGITLGSNYDVILEPTHLHIEYDPKNK